MSRRSPTITASPAPRISAGPSASISASHRARRGNAAEPERCTAMPASRRAAPPSKTGSASWVRSTDRARLVPSFDEIANAAARHGLIQRGGFHPTEADGVPALPSGGAVETPVMVGNAGPAMWEKFAAAPEIRSEEHTSELQSLMRNSYAVFCLKKKKNYKNQDDRNIETTYVYQ